MVSLRQKCYTFYVDNCTEGSVCFDLFNRRVHALSNPDDESQWIECLKRKKVDLVWKTWIKNTPYTELVNRARKQWCTFKRNILVQRTRLGYSREECILEWEARELAMKRHKAEKQNKKTEAKPKKKINAEIDNTDYAFIRIRYPKDVAAVFKREYENLLEDLETQLHEAWAWDRETMREIQGKIDQVKREILVFNYFN